MKTLVISLIGAAMLLAAPCFAAEDDTPPSVAPPAPQSSAQGAPRAPSKLEARFTTQWSGGSSTAQVPAEAASRVPPRLPKPSSE